MRNRGNAMSLRGILSTIGLARGDFGKISVAEGNGWLKIGIKRTKFTILITSIPGAPAGKFFLISFLSTFF